MDSRIVSKLPNTDDQIHVSRGISQIGTHYAMGGLAGAFYLGGWIAGNERARETGLIAAEAVAHSHAVAQALKFAAGRERPDYLEGKGRFWHNQQSFPSGHATTTWAVATVISRSYSERPFVRYGVYALPVVVSAARVGARRHFVSDLVVGGIVGHLIGAYLYDKHHDPKVGMQPTSRAGVLPNLLWDSTSSTYGACFSWQW